MKIKRHLQSYLKKSMGGNIGTLRIGKISKRNIKEFRREWNELLNSPSQVIVNAWKLE